MGGGGSALRVCAEHRGGINWLSLSPDGQRLLTGSEDGTARLWSTADGQCCALLRGRRARPPSSGSVLPILSPAQTSALPPTDPPQSPAPPIAGPQPGQLRTAGGYLAGGRGGEGRRGAGCSGVSGRGAPSAGLSLVNPEREMFPLQQLTQRNSPPPPGEQRRLWPLTGQGTSGWTSPSGRSGSPGPASALAPRTEQQSRPPLPRAGREPRRELRSSGGEDS